MRRLQALAFVALFFFQIMPAATVAWQQTRRLVGGRPIVLAVQTRDPRDLFRGEYSRLTYEIGNLARVEVVAPPPGGGCNLVIHQNCTLSPGTAIYVRLAPDSTGVDRAVQVTLTPPKGALFVAGKVTYGRLVRKGESLGMGTCEMPICMR